jgi:hypothetical protein
MIVRDRIVISADALAGIRERYDVQELSLFGSVLRDDGLQSTQVICVAA